MARRGPGFSGALRLIVGTRAYGSSAHQHTSSFLWTTAHIKPVNSEEPAMPSVSVQRLSHRPRRFRNSCEPPKGLQFSRSSGAMPIRTQIRNATASLTPACSGLATLAADARR